MTLKHIYEIAKVKQRDPVWECESLERVCKSVIASAHSVGIEVVRGDLDAHEYGEFLKERKKKVDAEEDRLLELKQAKLLRMA